VADEGILRLFGFRPLGSGAELDAALRDEVLPDFLSASGILDAYVARSGTGVAGERVIASMWESRDAMAAELGEASVIGRFHPERVEELTSSRLDILPLAFAVRNERDQAPIILRIYRGEVHPGELDAYVEEARNGTLADALANEGLVALYLGAEPPARFITVSAWTDWDAIARATGGNIRQPMTTRNLARIAEGSAAHYEILPSTSRPPAPAPRMPVEA
jgi:heme-degrading monooxygenase HmoA